MALQCNETASRCTTEEAHGTHVFEIVGYSRMKGIGVGKFVRSATFAIGGYDWSISFYPDGIVEAEEIVEAAKEYVAVYLELMSKNAEVRASYDMGFVNRPSGLLSSGCSIKQPIVFNSRDNRRFGKSRARKLRSNLELEASGYIQQDRLTIKCVLAVVKESQVSETMVNSEIEVPPSDITEHLGKLLESEEGADVTFRVGEETFPAHKILLFMRSPVFRAELFGPMREATMTCVTIEEMQPTVFRALLHFIYTDSLPDMGNLQRDDYSEMIRHLLVAADRYAMDRLKLICQNILGKNLDVETVATTLALADQHNCDKLKEVCIKFITSSNAMDAVVASKGYKILKSTCPSVLVDVLEKISRFRKA